MNTFTEAQIKLIKQTAEDLADVYVEDFVDTWSSELIDYQLNSFDDKDRSVVSDTIYNLILGSLSGSIQYSDVYSEIEGATRYAHKEKLLEMRSLLYKAGFTAEDIVELGLDSNV